MLIIIILILVILLFLVFINTKEGYKNSKKSDNIPISNNNINNINNIIRDISLEDKKNDKKLGTKVYKYDFVDGEQPLNGLGPSYEQNYPSTLPSVNNMFVVPDLSVEYVNLLNTRNNRYY